MDNKMLTLKNLTRYTPETFISGVIYLRDDEGNDWYESQKLFRDDTWKVVYGNDGIVCSCAKDVSMLYPVDMSVTEVESLPAGFNADLSWKFNGTTIVKITSPAI